MKKSTWPVPPNQSQVRRLERENTTLSRGIEPSTYSECRNMVGRKDVFMTFATLKSFWCTLSNDNQNSVIFAHMWLTVGLGHKFAIYKKKEKKCTRNCTLSYFHKMFNVHYLQGNIIYHDKKPITLTWTAEKKITFAIKAVKRLKTS